MSCLDGLLLMLASLRRLLHFSLRSGLINQPEHFFQQKTDSIATSPACPSGHLINPGQQF